MSLSEILNAKEIRTANRLAIAKEGYSSISLSFNIPGFPKSNANTHKAFETTICMLNDFLLAHRIIIESSTFSTSTDAAGDFYICRISESSKSIDEVKELCERFEQKHPLERIIDVDVMDAKGNLVSSGKKKKCFLCNKAAIECMRYKNHSLRELDEFVETKIAQFLLDKKLEQTKIKLATLATQCLLYELSLSPKPGLVDRLGNGAHHDMDYFSFLNSISSLSGYWPGLVELAYNCYKISVDETEELRLIGLAMERTMLEYTKGINTQKGAIFLIGMLVYTVAKLIFSGKKIENENIQKELINLNKANLGDELLFSKVAGTHGQEIYQKYGKEIGGGIRHELALGLPCVFNHALPLLMEYGKSAAFLDKESTAQNILIRCLLKIISKNKDSNILFRSNLKTLTKLQKLAADCLKNIAHFNENYKKIQDFCIEKNISPGGSADLLAASIFIYQLQNA